MCLGDSGHLTGCRQRGRQLGERHGVVDKRTRGDEKEILIEIELKGEEGKLEKEQEIQ